MQAKRPQKIIEKLQNAGFEAYFVGGCVRDTLLSREIHDWDITTSAMPEQVMQVFSYCIPTGIRHGTVTVMEDGAQAEVTTYRTDGDYHDGRHPDKVQFVRSLREDLARRDFTVNAMAMDLKGDIVDEFGGREDLAAKCIRCVGNAETRFSEDALRMLRAIRFAAQLGFSIEPQTEKAIAACAHLCRALSAERVRDEVEKTLLSPNPRMLEKMLAYGLLQGVGLTEAADLSMLSKLPAVACRWAGLRLLLPEFDPKTLRLPSKLCAHIEDAAASYRLQMDRVSLKRCIAAHGMNTARMTAELCGCEALLDEIVESGECVSLRGLAVKGADLPMFTGAKLGQVLNALLQHVLEYPEDNTKEKLKSLPCVKGGGTAKP